MRRALIGGGLAAASLILLVVAPVAMASHGPSKRLGGGVIETTYRTPALTITPGQNRIDYRPVDASEKPAVDGWIVGMKPNLVRADGSVPLSSKVMFHHGVWVNTSRGFSPFMAVGEEKTRMKFPDGYGYRSLGSDHWLLNDMIHNLTPNPMTLYIQYTIDFIPDTAPEAAGIRAVRPIWMDVEDGRVYPVFDVHRGTGGPDGKFTYPAEDPNAYPPGVHKNEWTVDQDGVLIATTGHVHAGGLATDLYLRRPGAHYEGPRCVNRHTARERRKCRSLKPRVSGDQVHLFKSQAHYFEPAGPVSWDMAMVSTRPDWQVQVKQGDTLVINATYEDRRASWYESMGIMVVFMAAGEDGRNPYKVRVDQHGILNHGHLKENNDHGGKTPTVGPDPRTLPNGPAEGSDPFLISNFRYLAGDFAIPGAPGPPPVVKEGQSLTYELAGGDANKQIWHSLTSCAAPCNKSTGIAYPIANGKFQFDSGQLGNLNGNASPPTVGRTTYSTPPNLPPGTYTYFCRIHPLMRGAFRVVK